VREELGKEVAVNVIQDDWIGKQFELRVHHIDSGLLCVVCVMADVNGAAMPLRPKLRSLTINTSN
jgi:hypothetical protein